MLAEEHDLINGNYGRLKVICSSLGKNGIAKVSCKFQDARIHGVVVSDGYSYFGLPFPADVLRLGSPRFDLCNVNSDHSLWIATSYLEKFSEVEGETKSLPFTGIVDYTIPTVFEQNFLTMKTSRDQSKYVKC